MYKKQDIEENWTFVQKLPQLLFVLVANHIIEVYLCFLSMTDISIYKIKALSKKPKTSQKIINTIIKNEIINTEEYTVKLSQMHADERNIYIFLTCIVMLLSINKLGERIVRIDEMEKLKKKKEQELGIDSKDDSKHKKNE